MKSTDSYTKVYMNQFRSKKKGPWPHSQALFSGENLRIRLKDPNKITMQSSEKATDMIIRTYLLVPCILHLIEKVLKKTAKKIRIIKLM